MPKPEKSSWQIENNFAQVSLKHEIVEHCTSRTVRCMLQVEVVLPTSRFNYLQDIAESLKLCLPFNCFYQIERVVKLIEEMMREGDWRDEK